LRVEGGTDPDIESYFSYNVSGIAGTVLGAKLRVFATSDTGNGPAVYAANNGWTETGITWANRPAVTSVARDDKGVIGSNVWVEYDVTPFVSGDGSYTFVLKTTSIDGVDFSSRQNTTNRPELVVTYKNDTETPGVPTNLTAGAVSSTRVDLAWSAPYDNVGVTRYDIYRNGNLLTSVGTQTTYADTTVAPSTAYRYYVTARDAAGNVSMPSIPADTVTPPATRTVTVVAAADSRVEEANPNNNFGTSTLLRADGGRDSDVETYVRFTVAGLSGSVQSAKLRVFATSGTQDGPAVYTASNTWTEAGIAWTSRPAVTSAARDDKARIQSRVWVEYDVTPFVLSNGTFTFVLRTTSNDGVDFASRENATNRPQLVVTSRSP
jgi:fibronectin type 3 domain-containing protein